MHSNKTGCISDQDLLQLHACLPSSSSSSCSALARMICLRKAFCFSSSPCNPAIAVRASTLLCCSVLSMCRCRMLSLQKSSDVSPNTIPLVSPVPLPYVVLTTVISCQSRCLSKARQATGLTCPNSGAKLCYPKLDSECPAPCILSMAVLGISQCTARTVGTIPEHRVYMLKLPLWVFPLQCINCVLHNLS